MKKLDLDKWKKNLDKALDLDKFKSMEAKRDHRPNPDGEGNEEDTEWNFKYPERAV
jgi:hypothetical protein